MSGGSVQGWGNARHSVRDTARTAGLVFVDATFVAINRNNLSDDDSVLPSRPRPCRRPSCVAARVLCAFFADSCEARFYYHQLLLLFNPSPVYNIYRFAELRCYCFRCLVSVISADC